MDTFNKPAQWALLKAAGYAPSFKRNTDEETSKAIAYAAPDSLLVAFARYIEQHEKPPVDPDLIKAREIYCSTPFVSKLSNKFHEAVMEGGCDTTAPVQGILLAIKKTREEVLRDRQ